MSTDDQTVAEYLNRLEAAAAALPQDRRTELIDEISQHIAEARAAQGAAGAGAAPDIAAVLDRLGSPEEIVRAAAEQGWTSAGVPGPPAVSVGLSGAPPGWQPASGYARPADSGQRLGWTEVAAVILLLVGGFLAGIGWFIGVILLWMSPRWRLSDKLLGTFVWPFGLAAVFVVLGLATTTTGGEGSCAGALTPGCSQAQPGSSGVALGLAAAVIDLVGPILVAIRLVRQARRWAEPLPADPAVMRPQ